MKTAVCNYCKYKDWPSVYFPCRDCTYAYDSRFERRISNEILSKKQKRRGKNQGDR